MTNQYKIAMQMYALRIGDGLMPKMNCTFNGRLNQKFQIDGGIMLDPLPAGYTNCIRYQFGPIFQPVVAYTDSSN